MLDRLKPCDRTAELPPRARVIERRFISRRGEAEHRRTVQQPVDVDARHAELEPVAFAAEHVRARHTDVDKADVRIDVLPRHRHVLLFHRHAWQIEIDEHRRDGGRRGRCVRHAHDDGKVGERCAADVMLDTIDHQFVAVHDRRGGNALRIRTGVRFGQREAGRLLAANHRFEIACELIRARILEHVADTRWTTQITEHMRRECGTGRGEVRLERALLENRQPLAAQLDRQACRVETECGGAAPYAAQRLARPDVFAAETKFLLHRPQFFRDEAAYALAGFDKFRAIQVIEHKLPLQLTRRETPCQYCSRTSLRAIFPLAFFGRSATKFTVRGSL